MESVIQNAEIIGLIVAALALVIGIWHVWSLGDQIERTKRIQESLGEQIQKTREIQGSISTRYIGQFPRKEFLSEIASIVGTAKRKVTILCDFPAYGAFASPPDFTKYRQTLENKAEAGVKIVMVCYRDARRAREYAAFFNRQEEGGWDRWKGAHAEEVDRYLRARAKDKDREGLSFDGILALLEADNKKICEIAHVSHQGVDLPISMFFWIVDDEKGIFAIPGLPEDFQEYGFITQDQELLRALANMQERYVY